MLSNSPKSFYLRLLLILVVAALLSAGCSGQTDRMWLNAPDWSRAQFVGQTSVGARPVFALGPDGQVAFLLVANPSGRAHPAAVLLDENGQKLWERDYPKLNMARPDKAQAYWAHDLIQAFWLSNESLYRAQIDPADGQMLALPQKLSGDLRVNDYAVVVDENDDLEVWFGGPRIAPGLYRLSGDDLTSPPQLIDEQGIRPTLAYDAAGVLHALWARYPMGQTDISVLYAKNAGAEESEIVQVAEPKAALGSYFYGPIMGITADTAYIFWSIEIRTGVAAGSVDARYVTFPLQDPHAVSAPTQLYFPADYHLAYEDWPEGEFRAGRRAPASGPRTGKITQIYPHSDATAAELVTIQRALTHFTMRGTAFQVGTTFFAGQKPESYQLLSFSGGDSRWPYITSDKDKWLYASWLERGEVDGFRVMYASTNPQIKRAYDQLSGEDYKTLAARTTFGLVSSALLFPFILMWMIAPIVLYLITFPLRRHKDTAISTGVIISLAISIIGYWVLKLGFLGGIRYYVPFSAWLPIIPESMALPLQLLVPFLILIISLLAAWLATYKRQNPSSILFLVIYLAVDGLLSAAIYGPLILATN